MINANVENFVSCYVETLQIVPQRMQAEISAYLQSDLQHLRLMSLCKRYVNDLCRSSSSQERKSLVQQLIFCLSAIQDICDRRAPMINEMHEILETQTQQLLMLQAKLKSENTQSSAPSTAINMESEVNIEDVDNANEPGTSESTSKHTTYAAAESELQSRVTSCRRKSRLSQRTAPNTGRLSRSRHALGRLDNTGSHPIGRHKSMFRSIKRNCAKESHLREHTSTEVRHGKLARVYPRYSRARQQQQRQQQQQRLKKQRALSTVDRTSTNRAILMREGRRNVPEAIAGPRYLKTGKRLGYRVSRLDVSCRSSNRTDWSNMERYYFEDDGQNTRSASNDSIDGGKVKISGNPGGTRNSTARAFGTLCESSWTNEDGRSSDELDASENTDDNDTETAPLHIREIRPYYCKDQGSLTSSSSIDPTGPQSKLYHSDRRTPYRQKKSTSDSGKVDPASVESGGAQVLDPDVASIRRRSGGPACLRDTGLSSRRRDRNYNLAQQYSKPNAPHSPDQSLRHSASQSGSPRFKGALGMRSPVRHASDIGDVSPDERLYCLCKKVSFGDMIACDNKHCAVEWFHFACVDIRVQPKGKWYCPLCRGESSKVKRMDV